MASLAEDQLSNTKQTNAIAPSTLNPETDINQTIDRPSTPISTTHSTYPYHTTSMTTSNNSTATKIPHLLTTSLLAANNKPDHFVRSGSMRVRGTKSNLHLNIPVSMDRMELVPGNVRNTLAKDFGSQDLATTIAGQGSSRRRLVPTSHNTAAQLRRSHSLRRSYIQGSQKTDSPKQESCGTAAPAAAADAASQYPEHLKQHGKVDDVPDGGEADCHVNCVNGETSSEMLAELELERQTVVGKEGKRVSLKLNGETPVSPTASTTAALSKTVESTKAAPVRPATLATAAILNSASASPKTATTPKTPKTPITPTTATAQQNHSHQVCPAHSKHYSHHHPLYTVPETKLTPKTPPVTPDSPNTYLDDDIDSMYSFATTTSGRSTMSCEHPYVARNGTTFSGRKMKYVVHCSNHAGQIGPDYLTPTQRAQRQIRRLKELLCVARQDLEQKDSEIVRLTREVVELRLFKASLSSPEERSASSDAVTVREAELKTSQDVSPIVDMVDDVTKSSPRHIPGHHHHHQNHNNHLQLSSEMQSSFADSGHFEDMTSMSVHSKDSYAGMHTNDIACGNDGASADAEARNSENYELIRQELIRMYEQRIEELIRNQDTATGELKRSHNDKVEALLQKLAECNTRYADIVPDYEQAKERIRELEKQLEDLQRKLAEHEDKQNKMYLHMYQKGQEAERIARADQALELAHRAPNKVSLNELLQQLQSTQDELENIRETECRNECGSNPALLTAQKAISLWVLGARKTIYRRLLEAQKTRTHVDPEVTLQFLKSAIFYFLTDKENSQGHLQAIENILEFTEAEKQKISKAWSPK